MIRILGFSVVLKFGIIFKCGHTILQTIADFVLDLIEKNFTIVFFNVNAASVQYSKEYPQIDPFDTFIQKMFQRSHIKEMNWKYEKEYRFYMNSYPEKLSIATRKFIISQDSFESITVGLFFPQKELDIIRRLAEKLEVPLYQISKSDRSYNLTREKLYLP